MYAKFVDIIDALVQKNNVSYPRIAIFRQPTREGELKKLSKTKREINTIRKMITDNLHYVQNNKDDFGFALSKSSKIIVDQIVNDIFRNVLMNCLHKISNKIHTHYLQIEKQHNDIEMLYDRTLQAYKVFSEMKNFNEPLEFFREFLDAVNTSNISVSINNLNDISDNVRKVKFFTTVSNSNKDLYMILLKNRVQDVLKLIEDLKNIDDFLNNLQSNLMTYKLQQLKDDSRIDRIKLSCASSKSITVENITDLNNIMQEIGNDEIYQKIKTMKLNRFQLDHIKTIFNTFQRNIQFSCTPEQLTVKGYNVKMCDVIKCDCWAHVKIIHVFALNKVFIDCPINKTGEEVQIFILAPTWEVIRTQKIILNGKDGEPPKAAFAKSSNVLLGNGTHGSQGFPGGPAGHFFGVGEQFINSNNLEIYANGGKGGPGQHGRNGTDGVTVEEIPESFLKKEFTQHTEDSINLEDIISNNIIIRVVTEKPSNGGDGGAGGHGGYPGTIVISGFGNLVNVNTSKNIGDSGAGGYGGYPGTIVMSSTELEGLRGRGGHKSSGRRSLSFKHEQLSDIAGEKLILETFNREWLISLEFPAGEYGKPGFSRKDEILPKRLYMVNPYFVISIYKEYIRENLYKNLEETKLRRFIKDLENDHYIGVEYNTLVFVRELEGLENQYLKLGIKIDFTPFYDSLLVRIEKFAISEKLIENKKVLNFIYTVVLTKMFALKERKKGKTVVNLRMYLNAMEESINEVNKNTHLQTVQKYQTEYNNILAKKIQKAKDFSKNIIEPEIQKLWEQTDDKIQAIINKINKKKNYTLNAKVRLENGRIIENTGKKKENSQKMNDFEREIRKVKNTVLKSISEVNILKNNVRKIEKKLVEFTNKQKDFIEQEKKTTKKSMRQINKVQSILSSSQSGYNFIQQLKNTGVEIENINVLIAKHDQQLRDLEKMKNQVYEKLMPELLSIEQTMNVIKSSVEGSSHVKLDITKWAARTTWKDLKLLLQKFTYQMSFELQNDLIRFIEKIDEGFSILIDLHDRIDTYADSVKQAKYIAHIESATMDNIRVTDAELSKAMTDLKLMIHSNILTEKYEMALYAFKQHYFPFAARVLGKFQLPVDLRLNDSETLRTNIIKRIKDMNSYIDESEATIDEYSKFVHENNVFDSDTTGSSPFYVRNHKTIKDEIQQLLNGSEILLKADVSKRLNYNAVKYNDIRINFKFKNKTIQNSFNSVLKNFALTITMVGNNFYRCGEKYYFISFNDDISITYTLDQDRTGNWINPNSVYTTIHRSHSFLSPYGMWSIKLKKLKKSVSWNQLRVYLNEIVKLELIGRGYYIEQDPYFNLEICNEYLESFYNVENVVQQIE
ncbi:uncharacterized protein [Chelonus insularis]|uniref:uncharacterized protein n=1 Tax=Chelonus insularis TaxID=460826 RepID=UPI00158B80D2|nr:uncharacterized protein LOC118064564 [Chelonus insularis]